MTIAVGNVNVCLLGIKYMMKHWQLGFQQPMQLFADFIHWHSGYMVEDRTINWADQGSNPRHLPQFTWLYEWVPDNRWWWDSSDGMIKMNSFRAAIAAWLDATIEVKMMFAWTGLLGAKCDMLWLRMLEGNGINGMLFIGRFLVMLMDKWTKQDSHFWRQVATCMAFVTY